MNDSSASLNLPCVRERENKGGREGVLIVKFNEKCSNDFNLIFKVECLFQVNSGNFFLEGNFSDAERKIKRTGEREV